MAHIDGVLPTSNNLLNVHVSNCNLLREDSVARPRHGHRRSNSSPSITVSIITSSSLDPENVHDMLIGKLDGNTQITSQGCETQNRSRSRSMVEKLRKEDKSMAREAADHRSEALKLFSEASVVACGTIVLLGVMKVAMSSIERNLVSCGVESWGEMLPMAVTLSCAGLWGTVDRLRRKTEAEEKAKAAAKSAMRLYMDIDALQTDVANANMVDKIQRRRADELVRKPADAPGLVRIPTSDWIMVLCLLLISLLLVVSIINP